MSDWMELDEQWRQRSVQMFLRCVNEPDMTKAQLAWYAACQSEKRRLEWKSLCLPNERQQERLQILAVVEGERSLFTPDSSYQESQLQLESCT